jgi:hypothetical protein
MQLYHPSTWPIAVKLWVSLLTVALIPIGVMTCEVPQRYFGSIFLCCVAGTIALILRRAIVYPIKVLLAAEKILGQDNFDDHSMSLHQSLSKVSGAQDEIGQLVRVFMEIVEVIRLRDQTLKLQVLELEIEVDETKRACQVSEIVETEYFQQLKKKAGDLKSKRWNNSNDIIERDESDYFHHLHDQVLAMKTTVSKQSEVGSSVGLESG